MTVALAAVSLPIFFTGPLLLLIFEYKLKWLPNVNYARSRHDPLQWFKSLILPWIALAFLFAALYARLTRANMLETMGEDYIRTARAKGLPERTVVVKHGLRAALTPIVTIFGIDLGTLIGTTVITETVFNLHGLGQAAHHRDPPAGPAHHPRRDDHGVDRARGRELDRRHPVRRGRSSSQLQLTAPERGERRVRVTAEPIEVTRRRRTPRPTRSCPSVTCASTSRPATVWSRPSTG